MGFAIGLYSIFPIKGRKNYEKFLGVLNSAGLQNRIAEYIELGGYHPKAHAEPSTTSGTTTAMLSKKRSADTELEPPSKRQATVPSVLPQIVGVGSPGAPGDARESNTRVDRFKELEQLVKDKDKEIEA